MTDFETTIMIKNMARETVKNAVPDYDLKDRKIYITWKEPGFVGTLRGLVLHKYPDGTVYVRWAQGGYYTVKQSDVLSRTADF